MKKPKTCRSCGSGELLLFLSLGRIPLSSILSSDQLATPEERRSIEVAFCRRCTLVQLVEDSLSTPSVVSAPQVGGVLEGLGHQLGPHAVVLALEGSSPIQLQEFVRAGAKVVWLEPNPERSKALAGQGIHVRPVPFGRSSAQALLEEGLQADVVLVNPLPAYSSDLNGLFENLAALLGSAGVAVVELPYVRALLEARHFEHFSHQQLNYFSVHAVCQLAHRHGLQLQNVEPLAAGYLRYFLGKAQHIGNSTRWYLEEERALGMTDATYYIEFTSHVVAVREALVALLTELRARGRRLAALGANIHSMALLNYVGLGREVIEFVVDPNIGTHGRYLAGVHIPIYGPKKLLEEQPDYLLLMGDPSSEVAREYQAYLQGGGKFIVAIPYPEILKASPQSTVPTSK